ncbi:glycosyltransferase [Phytomonospora sp. NPDC050363]|uniref:glycosyltransferase n=1 Tax=Phytomonospora sp. NPDC050363 TaxID=3155642 RepID=UPI003407CD19
MPASRDVAIITPWYPNSQSPFGGAFVQAMVAATAPGCDRVTVFHCDPWKLRDESRLPAVEKAHKRLMKRALRSVPDVAGAELVYVPVPLTGRPSFAERAHSYAENLRLALGGQPIPADVVHAHVGLRGGFVALDNARPDARVHVTEHSTFLDQVLAQPDSREMYGEVLRRCTSFNAVGDPVREPLAEAFPEQAAKIGLIPNAIDFGPKRAEPVRELRRWLYLGSLIERKGVGLLVEAFATCHDKDPDLRLTIVGEGVLGAELTARVAELGLSDVVDFTGSIPPAEALRMIATHDLLVHPSRLETFGMTIVEAIAAGTPILVTRSGGPQETLAGVEEAAGEMIDVTDDPATISEGYWRLRDRFPAGLDLARAREVLAGRYSFEAVGARHHELWFSRERA